MECSQKDDRRTFKGFYFGKCKLNIDYPLLNGEMSSLVFFDFNHRLHGLLVMTVNYIESPNTDYTDYYCEQKFTSSIKICAIPA